MLDGQGVELVENQKESMVGRKLLADKTKGICPFTSVLAPSLTVRVSDYRKLPDEEKLTAWKGLLKRRSTHSHQKPS